MTAQIFELIGSEQASVHSGMSSFIRIFLRITHLGPPDARSVNC